MAIQSGTYRRTANWPAGVMCPLCQHTVVGLWYDVGPAKERMCDECHMEWEKANG